MPRTPKYPTTHSKPAFERITYASPECIRAMAPPPKRTEQEIEAEAKVWWESKSPAEQDATTQELYDFWILLKKCELDNIRRSKAEKGGGV